MVPTRTDLVTIDDVRLAADRVTGSVLRTPLLPAPWAGGLVLKPENLQPTGSFKVRGALNAIAKLDPRERARGVVTHSSGNHAQALAWAARSYGVAATVVMPESAAPVKVEATKALGAHVVMVPPDQRDSRARTLRDEAGLAFIAPFDHRDVIAGAGTVGLEIVDDDPGIDTVLVPVGGGGLISGVSVAMKALAPRVRVVAVEPELAGDLAESMAAGERIAWDAALTYRTIADGVRLPVVGEVTWPHIQAHVDDVVTVPEDAILEAMALVTAKSRVVAEPTGALAAAAYLADPQRYGTAAAVVTGGNADPTLLARVLNDHVH